MIKTIALLMLLTGCGFKVTVDAPNTEHTIRHVLTVEVPLQILEHCDLYEDPIAKAECVEDISKQFLDTIKGLTEAITKGATNEPSN